MCHYLDLVDTLLLHVVRMCMCRLFFYCELNMHALEWCFNVRSVCIEKELEEVPLKCIIFGIVSDVTSYMGIKGENAVFGVM